MNENGKPIRIVPHNGESVASDKDPSPGLRLQETPAAEAETAEFKRYQCPHCGAKLETDEAIEGMNVPCPECGQEFTAIPMPKPALRVVGGAATPSGEPKSQRGKGKTLLWAFLAVVLAVGGWVGLWCAGIIQHIQLTQDEDGLPIWTARTGGVNWEFLDEDGSAIIIGATVDRSLTHVRIPAFFGWRRTRGVESAFAECDQLRSVRIPAGITLIGNDTFNGCASLKSIELPESVEEIGLRAFSGCCELQTIKIPNKVTGLHLSAFENCKKLQAVILPAGLKEITTWVFKGCDNLTNINLPEGLSKIGCGAFEKCGKLESINIPDSVAAIEAGAFIECSSLESVVVPHGVPYIDVSTFQGCAALTSVILPNTVTNLGAAAFAQCASLASILLPPQIQSIEDETFYECQNMTDINIPNGVTNIGKRAFKGCEKLTGINIPNGVMCIGTKAFLGCSSLTSISVSEGIGNIEAGTFSGCSNLTALTLPSTVTNIEEFAFYNCVSLVSLSLPQNVANIGSEAFEKCRSLEVLVLPDAVQCVGWHAFSDCVGLRTLRVPASWRGRGKLDEAGVPPGCRVVYGEQGEVRPTPQGVETNGLTAPKETKSVAGSNATEQPRLPKLSAYDFVIDDRLERNIRQSEIGPYLGAILHVVSQGRDGTEQAKKLGSQLSGKTEDEMSRILSASGYKDVERIVENMSSRARESAAVSGYQYINRLRFWQAAAVESLCGDYYYSDFEGLMAGYLRGRTPNPANLSKGDMPEILGALGISPSAKLGESQEKLAQYASHFNLELPGDRDVFARALVEWCVTMENKNFNLKNGMSADAVFKRIKDVAAILSQESGSPLVPEDVEVAVPTASVLPEYEELAGAVEVAKGEGTAENFKKLMTVWTGLGAKEKAATQKNVLWAYCAMLWSKGNTAAAEKRKGAIDYRAFMEAVTDACRACGGRGGKQETCRYCHGSGMVESGRSDSGSCPFCHGSGQVGGRLGGHPSTCPKCGGSGKSGSASGGRKACPNCTGGTIREVCRTCGGTGRVYSESKCKRVVEENLEEALRICHGGNEAGRQGGDEEETWSGFGGW